MDGEGQLGTALAAELVHRLEALRQQGLGRTLRRVDSPQAPDLRIAGTGHVLNFSSNDYLGLAHHPYVREEAQRSIRDYGAGAGASRLVCGSLGLFHDLEEQLARFKRTDTALLFSSGYAAAVGTIAALMGPGDIIVLDRLAHACLVDGARLSRATLRVFKHNDVEDLERILKWAADLRGSSSASASSQISAKPHTLIVTESLFSMDGDLAPLEDLVALKERYGAWLMVDEAHATGILGRQGRGCVEALGLTPRVEIQMGTLGKALGSAGGFIAGSFPLRDYLVHRARSFVFSTGPHPASAGAALGALKIATSTEGDHRRRTLLNHITRVRRVLRTTQTPVPFPSEASNLASKAPPAAALSSSDSPQIVWAEGSPILPWILGSESHALEASLQLLEQGILVPAIRFPTVGRGKARLRITLSAAHTDHAIDQLTAALTQIARAKNTSSGDRS